jgi:hypothetical protein
VHDEKVLPCSSQPRSGQEIQVDAARIMAAPDLLIHVSIVAPPAPRAQIWLVGRNGWAVPAFPEEADAELSAAVAVASIADHLIRRFFPQPLDPVAAPIALRRSMLRVCTFLWSSDLGLPERSLDLDDARSRLIAAGLSSVESRSMLEVLEEAGVLELHNGSATLAGPTLTWMQALGSGHRLEIEVFRPLDVHDKRPVASVTKPSGSLRFMGPPGRRVLCACLDPEDIDPRTPWLRGPGRQGPGLHELCVFTVLPPAVLRDAIQDLLGVTPVRSQPTSGPIQALPPTSGDASGRSSRVGAVKKRARSAFTSKNGKTPAAQQTLN